MRGVAQLGSALAWGARGRRFKSGRPDHYENIMNKNLLDVLACPLCKGKLKYDQTSQELICKFDKLAFPIRDDIPIMLVGEARDICKGE